MSDVDKEVEEFLQEISDETQQEVGEENWAELTKKQRAFLEAYHHSQNETEALTISEVSESSLYRWKNEGRFIAAFNRVKQDLPAERKSALVATDADIRDLARRELSGLAASLPDILNTLETIALHGNKDSDRLRAIEDIMEFLGIEEGVFNPTNTEEFEVVQKRILRWTNPKAFRKGEQAGSEGDNDTIDADYETLANWAEEEHDAS